MCTKWYYQNHEKFLGATGMNGLTEISTIAENIAL